MVPGPRKAPPPLARELPKVEVREPRVETIARGEPPHNPYYRIPIAKVFPSLLTENEVAPTAFPFEVIELRKEVFQQARWVELRKVEDCPDKHGSSCPHAKPLASEGYWLLIRQYLYRLT